MPYLIYLMLKTGLRVGEALALTWKEVDFLIKLFIHLKRIDSAKHIDSGKPKTPYSVREIPISDDLIKSYTNFIRSKKKLIL